MAEQTTDFPLCREAAAFRAVEDILREDPVMAARDVRFRTFDGQRMDGMKPSFNQGPIVTLTPRVLPSVISTRLINTAQLAINLRVEVPGMVAEDIFNFWGAIRSAMVRSKPFRDTTVARYLHARVNCYRYWVNQPGYGAWESRDRPPTNGLPGEGQIILNLQVWD